MTPRADLGRRQLATVGLGRRRAALDARRAVLGHSMASR